MSRHQFFWTTTRAIFCRWLQFKYRFQLESGSDPEPKPPYIVVSNHGNFFDPWMIGLYFKKALHIMMSDDGFRAGPASKWYLTGIGAYAKKKGSSDIKAMKSTLAFLKSQEPVLIFPEGQASWDGETQPIYGGIERMVKRSNCSLAIMRFRGNFLSRPWWAKGKRKGRISIKRTVFKKEVLATMSEQEILDAIRQGIYSNDILDKDVQSWKFNGSNLAEGLERLVWICPFCNAEDTLVAKYDLVKCTQCNSSLTIDPYCRLRPSDKNKKCPDNLHAWVQDHKAAVKKTVAAFVNGNILAENADVTLLTINAQNAFEPVSKGTISLNSKELIYTEQGSDHAMHVFPVSGLDNYVIQKKDIFEITYQGKDFRFDMNGRSPMKWLMFFRYLNGFEEIEKRGVIQ